MTIKNGFQIKLIRILNEFSLREKWPELSLGLKYLNKILTRFFIDSYWKHLFQIVYRDLPNSIETIPQFIDCLHTLNIRKKNEIVYSFVFLLLSKNYFKYGADLLQMYHLTNKFSNLQENSLTNLLNSNFQFVKWKQALNEKNFDLHQQLAEKCSFQLKLLIESLDISDCEIKKLAEILIYYDQLNDLQEILETYAIKHVNYLNAHKYLFDFNINYNNFYSLEVFQRISSISPSDSYILKYCRKFNDLVLVIDCIFDMLDYFPWKYNEECWTIFNQILLTYE